MNPYVRRIHTIAVSIVSLLSMMASLTACYYCDTTQFEDYGRFREEMQKMGKQLDVFLPALESDEPVEDMYLFYSDRDLIDTYYTVYLNCRYTEEKYRQEEERIVLLFNDEDLLIKNSESFGMDSLMYGEGCFGDADGIILDYMYVLFDEAEQQIVYIAFFDKELYGKYTNIPEKYLPKELIDSELMNSDI